MTATIAWNISQLDCKPQEDGKTDVVVTAHWQCNGTQDAYSASVYAACSFTLEQGASFTPYDQLTQDQVLGWCWSNGVDKDSAEAAVQTQIDNQINPPVIQPALPW